MSPSSPQRVSVGFKGGQVLALRVPEAELESLNRALAGGGWHELKTEDGPVRLDVGNVVYVRVEDDAERVGFGL